PEVATVANWITHYAANLKESSKRMVEKTSSTRNIENSTRTDDRETEEIGNNNEQVEHIVEECVIRGRVKKTFSNNDNFSNEFLPRRSCIKFSHSFADRQLRTNFCKKKKDKFLMI